jgi:hypothetical protein
MWVGPERRTRINTNNPVGNFLLLLVKRRGEIPPTSDCHKRVIGDANVSSIGEMCPNKHKRSHHDRMATDDSPDDFPMDTCLLVSRSGIEVQVAQISTHTPPRAELPCIHNGVSKYNRGHRRLAVPDHRGHYSILEPVPIPVTCVSVIHHPQILLNPEQNDKGIC